ncbi:MAG: DUF4013 domain-containing protein [Myxococcota bacterium]|nr:DUF4013 domain-containing protein [Myxococcota bacterium]
MDITHQNNSLSGPNIDIGAALEFAKADPDWVKKCGLHGLVLFIPIAGTLSMLGWSRKVYEGAKTGDRTLPELDIGSEVSHGIAPLVAVLNLIAVLFPVIIFFVIGTAIGSAVGGEMGGIISIIIMLLLFGMQIVVSLMMIAIMPELQRRGYNGEMGPLFSPGTSFRAIKANPKAYAMTVLGLFVAQLISSIGAFACYIGVFITMPFGNAMAAHILAQWDSMVQLNEAG